jgi:hypothetical protein
MADENLLRELLTSPLEEKDKRRIGSEVEEADPPPERAARVDARDIALFAGAALLGIVVVLGVRELVSDDPGAAAPVTTTPPTSVSGTTVPPADAAPPTGLPAGYEPVDERLGMRVERILKREDGIFVTITTVTHNSLDPEETSGFQGGSWAMVLEDGTRIESTVDAMDALAQGVVTVVFPPGDDATGDIAAIELTGLAHRTSLSLSATSDTIDALPEDGSDIALVLTPNRFDIDAGVSIVLDELTLSTTGGELTWTLDAEVPAAARLDPALRLLRTDETETAFTTRIQTSSQSFFHPSAPAPILGDGGISTFAPAEDGATAAAPGFAASVEMQVTWAVYTPVTATLPVDGAIVAVVG